MEKVEGVSLSKAWASMSLRQKTALRGKMVRQGRRVVVVSVYIPPGQGVEDLRRRLEMIEVLMARQRMMDPEVEFIIGGDFNSCLPAIRVVEATFFRECCFQL